jgi:hypothetical protein
MTPSSSLWKQVLDRIDLFDLKGREISHQLKTDSQQITLTMDTPTQGIYFLRLIQKDKSRVYKILVE